MFNESGKTYIRTLHISTNQSDTLVRQLRLARTFSSLDLQPPGLPASAILCVQKIRAPRQPTQSAHAWEQGVSASLRHLHEHAKRPAKKEPAPNAQAILFSDRAELLACLAHDWYTGKLTQHWWWQSLFPNQDRSNLPIQSWLTSPEYVPAALHHLATRGEATHFVRLLPSPIISTLLENIIRHFALHTLHSIYYPDSISLENTQEEKPRSQKEPSSPFITFQPISPSSLPISDPPYSSPPTSKSPWQPWVPECHEIATYSNQQLFTGIALMLIRAPHIVRTQAFAHTIYQWQQNVSPIQATSTAQPANTLSPNSKYPSYNNAMPAANAPQETATHQTNAPSPFLTTQNPTTPQPTPHSNHNQQNQESYIYPDTSSSAIQAPLSYNDPSTHATAINKEKETIRNSNAAIPDHDALLSINAETIPPANSPLSAKTSSSSEKTHRAEPSTLEAIGITEAEDSAIGISKQEQSDPLQPSSATLTDPSSQYACSEHNNEQIPSSPPQDPDAHLPQRSELSSLQTTPTLSQELSSTSTLPFIATLPMPIEGTYETRFGGLFYLVNVALYLELYGDFTAPAQPGLPLTIWDFLALLGYRLTSDKIQADPIWELFALLAGREKSTPPDTDFEPLSDWRIPAHWLKAFPGENNWLWQKNAERVQLYHPAGFLVLDLPLTGDDPQKQLAQELLAYQGQQPITLSPLGNLIFPALYTSNPTGISPQIARWLDRLIPYLYRRLQRALATNDDPIPTLCMHHAHIALTATHLDISLSLAALPIELRMAGLDRNPGWVPAAGHYITFYFR